MAGDRNKLHDLCSQGKLRQIKELLAKVPNATDWINEPAGVFGYTPLHEAISSKNADILRLLLTYGGQVDALSNGRYTPLHIAASIGDAECIRVLLENNASLTLVDEFGKTPYATAQLNHRKKAGKILKTAEIKILAEKDDQQLRIAIEDLQHGKDIEENCFEDALEIAVARNNHRAVGYLVIHGARNLEQCMQQALLKPPLYKTAVLLLLCHAAKINDKSIVEHLCVDLRNATKKGGAYPMGSTSKVLSRKYLPMEWNRALTYQRIFEMREAARAIDMAFPVSIALSQGNLKIAKIFLFEIYCNKILLEADWHGLALGRVLPEWLKEIDDYKRVVLSHNLLTKVPDGLIDMKNLLKLDLAKNSIEEVPKEIFELKQLRNLNLLSNDIRYLPNVSEWSKAMKVLNLKENNLRFLDDSIAESELEDLNLAENNLGHVPECICEIKTLQTLDLSRNKFITILPPDLAKLTKLNYLGIEHMDQITDPPPALRGSTSILLRHLKARLRHSEAYYTMKLMIVGLANRGKTTLMHRLDRDFAYSKDQSTQGVDIREIVIQRANTKSFTFKCWDFAGQEEYYATHQCFLSQRSLYVLVWDVRDEEKGIESLKPWLNNLQTRVPRSRVIIVGTHLDQVTKENLAAGFEKEMNTKVLALVRNYKELFCLEEMIMMLTCNKERDYLQDCKAKIDRLRNLIYEVAKSMTVDGKPNSPFVMGEMVPSSYLSLAKMVSEKQAEIEREGNLPLLWKCQFEHLVNENASKHPRDYFDPEDVDVATTFLHDIGIILHYNDPNQDLRNLYFISPSWLCDLMAKIVTVKAAQNFIRDGILLKKDIPFILGKNNLRFNKDFFPKYLRLLARFQIACKIDEERILVPSRLPERNPMEYTNIKEPEQSLRRVHSFSCIPQGFWSRFISRFLLYLKEMLKVAPASNECEEKGEQASGNESINAMDESANETHDGLQDAKNFDAGETGDGKKPILKDRHDENVPSADKTRDAKKPSSTDKRDENVPSADETRDTKKPSATNNDDESVPNANETRDAKKPSVIDNSDECVPTADETHDGKNEDAESSDEKNNNMVETQDAIDYAGEEGDDKASRKAAGTRTKIKDDEGECHGNKDPNVGDTRKRNNVDEERPPHESYKEDKHEVLDGRNEISREGQDEIDEKTQNQGDEKQVDVGHAGHAEDRDDIANESELNNSTKGGDEDNKKGLSEGRDTQAATSDEGIASHSDEDGETVANQAQSTVVVDGSGMVIDSETSIGVDGSPMNHHEKSTTAKDRDVELDSNGLQHDNKDYAGADPVKVKDAEDVALASQNGSVCNQQDDSINVDPHAQNSDVASIEKKRPSLREEKLAHESYLSSTPKRDKTDEQGKVTRTGSLDSTQDLSRNDSTSTEKDAVDGVGDRSSSRTAYYDPDEGPWITESDSIPFRINGVLFSDEREPPFTCSSPNRESREATPISLGDDSTASSQRSTPSYVHSRPQSSQPMDATDATSPFHNGSIDDSTASWTTKAEAGHMPWRLGEDFEEVRNDRCRTQDSDSSEEEEEGFGDEIDISYLIDRKYLSCWGQGILLNHPKLFLSVSIAPSEGDREIIETRVSRSLLGYRALAFIVDHMRTLIKEWYPGLDGDNGLVPYVLQFAPCPICKDFGINPPYRFNITKCLEEALTKDCIICDNNHTPQVVNLKDLCPDLLFMDLEPSMQLQPSELKYIEADDHLLGQGQFGKVYRGKYEGNPAAIKLFNFKVEENLDLREALDHFYEVRQEAVVLSRVKRHPFIITFFGVAARPKLCLVIELATKGTLRDALKDPMCNIRRIVTYRIAQQIANAMTYLHSLGIIHRDLKSDNVLLFSLDADSEVNIKLADFGTANFISSTGLKNFIGTPGFISPEIFEYSRTEEYTDKVDVYSYAMVLYELISRRRPFHDVTSALEINSEVKNGKRPKLQDLPSTCYGLLTMVELMLKAWQQEATKRPSSFEVNKQMKSPSFCLLFGKRPLGDVHSPRQLCYVHGTNEVWITCDDKTGAAILVVDLETSKIKHKFIPENKSLLKAKESFFNISSIHDIDKQHVAIVLRSTSDYISIYSAERKKPLESYQVADDYIRSIAVSEHYVILGCENGCFTRVAKNHFLKGKFKERSSVKVNTRRSINALITNEAKVVQGQQRDRGNSKMVLGCDKYIYKYPIEFDDPESIEPEAVRPGHDKKHVAQMDVSVDGRLVFNSYGASPVISCRVVETMESLGDTDCSVEIKRLIPTSDVYDQRVTCFCVNQDTLWVGTGSGHILIYEIRKDAEPSFITWLKPYKLEVRSIVSCYNANKSPRERPNHLVVSIGKEINSNGLCYEGNGLCSLNGVFPADSQPVTRKNSSKTQPMQKYDEDFDKKMLLIWDGVEAAVLRQLIAIN